MSASGLYLWRESLLASLAECSSVLHSSETNLACSTIDFVGSRCSARYLNHGVKGALGFGVNKRTAEAGSLEE